jgi:hypothetical protein
MGYSIGVGLEYIPVILGLQNAPGELIDIVGDKMDAPIAEGGIDAPGVGATSHGRVLLILADAY